MGHDTLSAQNKFGSLRETARQWLTKLKLIEPADEEPEQIERLPRQTYVPPRQNVNHVREPQNRKPAPVRREASAPQRQTVQTGTHSAPVKKVDTAVFFVDSLLSCTYAIKAIIEGTSVIVHFINTDRTTSQRIIDTLSGAAFALDAKIKKVEDNTYLIAPRGMNINVVRPSERRY